MVIAIIVLAALVLALGIAFFLEKDVRGTLHYGLRMDVHAAKKRADEAYSVAQDALGKADEARKAAGDMREARKAAGDMREALNKHLQRFLDLESRVDFVYGEVEDAQKTADSALAKASARQTTTPTARPPKKPKTPDAPDAQ